MSTTCFPLPPRRGKVGMAVKHRKLAATDAQFPRADNRRQENPR